MKSKPDFSKVIENRTYRELSEVAAPNFRSPPADNKYERVPSGTRKKALEIFAAYADVRRTRRSLVDRQSALRAERVHATALVLGAEQDLANAEGSYLSDSRVIQDHKHQLSLKKERLAAIDAAIAALEIELEALGEFARPMSRLAEDLRKVCGRDHSLMTELDLIEV